MTGEDSKVDKQDENKIYPREGTKKKKKCWMEREVSKVELGENGVIEVKLTNEKNKREKNNVCVFVVRIRPEERETQTNQFRHLTRQMSFYSSTDPLETLPFHGRSSSMVRPPCYLSSSFYLLCI